MERSTTSGVLRAHKWALVLTLAIAAAVAEGNAATGVGEVWRTLERLRG